MATQPPPVDEPVSLYRHFVPHVNGNGEVTIRPNDNGLVIVVSYEDDKADALAAISVAKRGLEDLRRFIERGMTT